MLGRSNPFLQSGHNHFAGLIGTMLVGATLLLLSSCKSLTTTPVVVADSAQRWALLPIRNLSTTPLAGERVSNLLETELRRRGVTMLGIYQDLASSKESDLASLLDSSIELEKAREWARTNGYRYALTGTVNEWHYKTGTDKEPAVGLNLKLIDLPTGLVLWQGTGSRTGWGYANLARIGEKVTNDLVTRLSIQRQSVAQLAVRTAAPSATALVGTVERPAVETVEAVEVVDTPAADPYGLAEIPASTTLNIPAVVVPVNTNYEVPDAQESEQVLIESTELLQN